MDSGYQAKGCITMKLTANVMILAKFEKPWNDSHGKEHISWVANIAQKNGMIIDTLRLSKEQYESIEAGKNYMINAEYGKNNTGAGYLRVLSILPAKNM